MKPDKYQLEAIECDKNLLLIAGAGAGKTYTITEKIKYLIEENYLKEGFDDYMSKPINKTELERVLVKFLKK